MSSGEFDIIKRYFQRPISNNADVIIGIGDDCAILDVPEGYHLAVTTDSLVSGVHFFADVDPYRLGYKSLAVNLSDLAAMGAIAKWVSLAITLPDINEPWLAEFCRGFFALADKYNVVLIGGDTTKGPLSITVSAKGIVKKGQVLTRANAAAGDLIFVSGPLGDGALGLAYKSEGKKLQQPLAFVNALEITEPRLKLASILSEYASSCIDISDGLSQDLSHILQKSQCKAQLQLQQLPFSDAMLDEIKADTLSLVDAWQLALTGGDDYELLFTVAATKVAALKEQLAIANIEIYEIGKILATQQQQESLLLLYQQQPVALNVIGWDHFK